MKPIIEVNHVWKEYQKGIDRRYKSLRDTLADIPGRLFGGEKEKFWALEDIDFKVEAGESVGIIGRNGAGKSTLLKILSRITPPTKGEIILRGRVASLLEVGTGFHPELTGRENVFFNGSILGMRHQEIKKKFDEIVDFSGVESFIDTPLKHYSSGMQMRLAFSVAAHLDSEILLIDEVLAVGDAEFQKKCMGKMDEVSKGEGKTILFVSHNFEAIKKLCKKGILLNNNLTKYSNKIDEIFLIYLEKNEVSPKYVSIYKQDPIYFKSVEILNPNINNGDDLILNLEIKSKYNINVGIEIEIKDEFNLSISYSSNAPMQGKLFKINSGTNCLMLTIKKLLLAKGKYFVQIHLIEPWKQEYDVIQDKLSFNIINSDPFNSGFMFNQSFRRGSFFHEIELNRI
jgi:lipopolysaccharide transport system ATP-binding protein